MNCWVEISRAHLRHNFRTIQNLVGPAKIIAVVKANAYGCGALECARIFAEEGAAMLAVTRVEEAVALREGGISAPILLLAPALPDETAAIFAHDLTACVADLEDARRLAGGPKTAKIHLKINTGMGRLGVSPQNALEIAQKIRALPGVELEGVWTHFANALDAATAASQTQFELFAPLAREIGAPLHHCANSAALTRFPAMRLDAVRPGTLLYGQFPAASAKISNLELRDPFAAKARIAALRTVKKGEKIGYGSEWTAPRDGKIATLACGYADGLSLEPRARVETFKTVFERALRTLKNPQAGRFATLRGQKVPIIGRIAMQSCSLDVSSVAGVQIGDEVLLPMRRVMASAHLPRVYV